MLRGLIALALIAALPSATKARAAPPPIEAYGNLPAIGMMKLSPSGERYAFIAIDGENRHLYVETIANEPLASIEIGDVNVRDVEWAGEDHVLVTSAASVAMDLEFVHRRETLRSVVVVDLKAHKNFAVFDGPFQRTVAKTVAGSFGTAEIDGHWYGYFGGLTYTKDSKDSTSLYLDKGYADLYRVDLDTGDFELVAKGIRNNFTRWLVSPTGEVIARTYYDDTNGNWRLMSGKSDGSPLASGHAPFGGIDELKLGRAADRVLIRKPDENGGYAYQEIPLSGGAPAEGDIDGDSLTAFSDRKTNLWIGLEKEGDEQPATFFAPAFEARAQGARKAFPNSIAHLESWSTDFNRMIVYTDGGDDAGTWWLVDVLKHSAVILGESYPIKPADVGPVRMVDWKAADGLALRGVLTLPPGREARNLPLVVLPHGGPEDRDYPGFDWLAQAFASRGYAVFQPNFRGSSGYGVSFRDAGFGEWGRKMQTDISDGVAELARQGLVDPKRSCVVGASYGGYAALAGVTVQHGLYRCAVSVAGVADLAGFLSYARGQSDLSSGTMRYLREFIGKGDISQISPVALADRADAPILLIHGANDTTVPVEQSETMERALKRAGKPVDFVRLTGEDHTLFRRETRIAMLKSAVEFVAKYNPAN
jgi:dipeptidyl aminopeptidase/acylaminoacyl peptidase